MNWPTVPLCKLCKMDRCGVRPDDPDVSLLPYVGVENIEPGSGNIDFSNRTRIGNQKSTSFRFDERHILYGKLRPYLNKVAVPAFAGKCSTELVPLLSQAGVDREFLGYLLRRKETVESVMSSVTGARMPRTDMKALLSIPVPLPPFSEQRRIVDILNQAAKIERLRKQAEERLQEFIPALFIRMFGDPVENPMGWKKARVRDLGTVDSGAGFPKIEQGVQGEEFPFLKVGDMNLPGNEIAIQSWNNTISNTTRERLRAKSLPAGSVIFPKIGAAIATNKKRMLTRPSCVDNNVMAIVPDTTNIHSEYLYGLMLHKDLGDFASAADPPSMRKTTVENWCIQIPPQFIQLQYAEIIESARALSSRAFSANIISESLNASLLSGLLKADK